MKQNISSRMQKRLVALFFLFLTLAGLILGSGYGVPWDEKMEQEILKQNVYEYAITFLGTDNSMVRDLSRHVIRISESIERDHGSALFYPMSFLLIIRDAHLVMQIWHVYIWLLFMLGVIAIYIIMREIGLSRIIACMTSLLLYLSPRFFAEGHYNNKDVILLSMALCIFALAARLSRDHRFKWVLLFSLAGAFTSNLKIIGAFAWGLAGIAVLWRWFCDKNIGKRELQILIVGVVTFLITYILITPALWTKPIVFFRYLIDNMTHFSRWEGTILFQGKLYDPTRGSALPWFYLPQLILITIPIPYLIFALIGQIIAIVMCVKGNCNRPFLTALTIFWLLPLVYALLSNTFVYNGWRHFYFVNAGLLVMGGICLGWLSQKFSKTIFLKTTFALATASVFVFQAACILINHPYQYAYYNALAGKVDCQYELDYWGVSSYNALQKLADYSTRNQELPLSFSTIVADYTSIDYPLDINYSALPKDTKAKMQFLSISEDSKYFSLTEDASYLIFNTCYVSGKALKPPSGYNELFTISSYNNVLAVVYEKES